MKLPLLPHLRSRQARRLHRAATFAMVRGGATTLGAGAAAAVVWWLKHH